jgi:hypothetical protein
MRQTVITRHDVPVGRIPSYQDFVRHVWAWRDEDGLSPLGRPPRMYAILIRDPSEARVAAAIIATSFPSNTTVVTQPDDEPEVTFKTLEALHAFLLACALFGRSDSTARRICECVLWTLGFRWV